MSKRMDDIVAIDGPAGVGKSTLSRRLAARLGYTYLDTGAMYRAAALFLDRAGTDRSDDTAVAAALEGFSVAFLPAVDEQADVEVVMNGERVGPLLRTVQLSMRASTVSALPSVRRRLTAMQQEFGKQGKIVAEGRDTGTVVFPGARYKFYLDASPEARANRRALQLQAQGKTVDEAALLQMTIKRDRQDMERAIAPLTRAPDAHYLDTTSLTIEQVLAEMMRVIETR